LGAEALKRRMKSIMKPYCLQNINSNYHRHVKNFTFSLQTVLRIRKEIIRIPSPSFHDVPDRIRILPAKTKRSNLSLSKIKFVPTMTAVF
jgi:hypothetical protein